MNEWPNGVAIITVIAFLWTLIGFNRACKTHSIYTLMIGVLLIALSAWELSYLDFVKAIMEVANKNHIGTPVDYARAIKKVELLKLVLGGAILSVGTNIIAAWFTANQAFSKR